MELLHIVAIKRSNWNQENSKFQIYLKHLNPSVTCITITGIMALQSHLGAAANADFNSSDIPKLFVVDYEQLEDVGAVIGKKFR